MKNKNVRLLGGQPLYRHICKSLLACPEIAEIMIDTDSAQIQEEVLCLSERIRIIRRPKHLCGGHIPMNEILLHDVEEVDAEFYLQTHSTNPLLESKTISEAIAAFLLPGRHDSLFAVTPIQSRLWHPNGSAVNHDPDVLLRTQDLPPFFEENSNLYIFSKKTLLRRKNRIGKKPLLFPIDRIQAWDIDTEEDFALAELLYLHRSKKAAK